MNKTTNRSFMFAAYGLFAGSLAHVIGLLGGPDWIEFMGAPPEFVESARQGNFDVVIVTLGIAVFLAIWGLYALSGAGRFRKLPFLKTVIGIVAAIFIARGVLIIPQVLSIQDASAFVVFHVFASLFVLALGVALAIGLRGLLRADK